jgi:hypothetical protein
MRGTKSESSESQVLVFRKFKKEVDASHACA